MTARTLLVIACIFSPLAGAFLSPRSSSTTPIGAFKNPFVTESAVASSDAPPILSTNPNNPLIKLANDMVYNRSGFYSAYDESAFADDFVFRGPYIGPLNKKDYFSTMDTFKIYEALPDINPNAWGFSIDPKNPNRVWYWAKNTGTFDGEPIGLGNGITFPPNGAVLDSCPETHSMLFDEDRKIKLLTVGYVADRFEGNTGGDAAAVGIFNVAGIPFPKPGPLLTFFQWFGTEIYNGGAYSYSKDVPSWWTSKDRASEGY